MSEYNNKEGREAGSWLVTLCTFIELNLKKEGIDCIYTEFDVDARFGENSWLLKPCRMFSVKNDKFYVTTRAMIAKDPSQINENLQDDLRFLTYMTSNHTIIAYDPSTNREIIEKVINIISSQSLTKQKKREEKTRNEAKNTDPISEIVQLDPNNLQNLFSRAHTFVSKGEFTNALTDISKAIKIVEQGKSISSIGLESFYALRGIIYANMREEENALSDFTKSLLINPQWSIYHSRAEIYFDRKEFCLALTDLKAAQELDPNHIEILNLRKRVEEAITNDQKIKELETHKRFIRNIKKIGRLISFLLALACITTALIGGGVDESGILLVFMMIPFLVLFFSKKSSNIMRIVFFIIAIIVFLGPLNQLQIEYEWNKNTSDYAWGLFFLLGNFVACVLAMFFPKE